MNEREQLELSERLYALFASRYGFDDDTVLRTDIHEKVRGLVADASGSSLATEERDVTILLSDLRGFTAMTERLEPLETISILNRYFKRMSEVILRYGGTIDKFMGDAIMVLFGAPAGRPDDVERAIACAVEMQVALGEVNAFNTANDLPPLYMGIGINSGRVVAGNLGSHLHSEYTVIGDHVNLAARIESHSLRGQVLLSEHTFQRAREYVVIGQENELQVKGKREFIKMYELLSTTRPKLLAVPAREGRKSPRVQVDLPVTFRVVEGKRLSDDECEGRILDMSYGGMLMTSGVQLEQFADVCFPLNLTLSSNQTSDVYAKVLRVREEEDGARTYPLEITSIDAEAARTLKLYIDRIVESH